MKIGKAINDTVVVRVDGKDVDAKFTNQGGIMTVNIDRTAVGTALMEGQSWFGVGGLRASIYALIKLGVVQPYKIASYLDASQPTIRVTIKNLVYSKVIVKIGHGRYEVTEQPLEDIISGPWPKLLDQIFAKHKYLLVHDLRSMMMRPSLLPESVQEELNMLVQSRVVYPSRRLPFFERALAHGLIIGRYRPVIEKDKAFYLHPYSFRMV